MEVTLYIAFIFRRWSSKRNEAKITIESGL